MTSTPRRPDRSLEALLDRIEDRLMDAPIGLHQVGEPASPDALARARASGFSDEAAALWGRWDGIELAAGEVALLPLAEHDEATREALEAGQLREGDRVVGHYGLAALVLPQDPWDEGGDVVMVEDDGERAPYASSVVRLALGLVAEASLLYDDEGESREDLFGDDGQLTARAERRILRRRLDFDEDAPFPRFRLAQLLRRAKEYRGARSELRRVLHCAPEFTWAHWELGRAALELWLSGADDERSRTDAREEALASFASAAEKAGDDHLRALFLAWQARTAEEPQREQLAAEVKRLDPGFVAAREAGLREAIEDEDGARARELLALGLAIEPRALGLLELREAVEALPEEPPELDPMPVEEVEEALELADDPSITGGLELPAATPVPTLESEPSARKPSSNKPKRRPSGKRRR